jgi:hypothetical protein
VRDTDVALVCFPQDTYVSDTTKMVARLWAMIEIKEKEPEEQ